MYRRLLIVLVTVTTTLQAANWYPYVEGYGRTGNFREGGSAHLFAPLWQNCSSLVFAEADICRIRKQTDGSVGLGYRRLITPRMALGVAGFVDVAYSDAHNTYLMGTLSGEAHWNCFEAHVNGYLPNSTRHVVRDEIIDNVVVQDIEVFDFDSRLFQTERAYSGFDAMVGYNFECGTWRVRTFGGYYNYDRTAAHHIQGPRANVVIEYDNLLGFCKTRGIFGGDWQYDSARGHSTGIYFGLRIPIACLKRGCCKIQKSICRRMGDLVRRECFALVQQETQITPLDPIFLGNLVFFDQNGMGTGVQNDPTNLTDALTLTGPGDVLFALNDNGNITSAQVPLELQQQLIGFGDQESTVVSFGPGLDVIVTDLTGTGRVTLQNNPAADIVILNDENSVRGLRLFQGRNAVVNAPGFSNTLFDLIIEDSAANGLFVDVGNQLTATDITINNTGIFADSAANITMTNVNVTGAPGFALEIVNPVGPVQMLNSTLASNGSGVSVMGGTGQVDILNTTITQPGGTLFNIDGTTGNVNYLGGTATNTAGDGITITNALGGTITLNNVNVLNSVSAAVTMTSNAAMINVDNGFFSTDGGITGFTIANQTGDVAVTNSQLMQPSGGVAVDVDMTAATIDLTGLSILNTNSVGFNVIDVQNTLSGTVDFGTVDILSASGTAAAFLDSNTGDVNFIELNAEVTGGQGILATNNTGTMGVMAGTLDVTGAIAAELDTTASAMNFTSITSTTSPTVGIFLDTFTGTFGAGTVVIDTPTSFGIDLMNSTGNTTLGNVTITDAGNNAIDIDNNPGPFSITNGGLIDYTFANTFNGIDAQNSGDISIAGSDAGNRFEIRNVGTLPGTDRAIFAFNCDSLTVDFANIHDIGAGAANKTAIFADECLNSVTVTNSLIDNIDFGNAIVIDNNDNPNNFIVNVSDNTITGDDMTFATTQQGINIRYASLSTGNITATIERNTLTGLDQGMLLNVEDLAAPNLFNVNDNIIRDTDNDGIDFLVENATVTTLNLNGNLVERADTIAFDISSDDHSGSLTLLADDNTIRGNLVDFTTPETGFDIDYNSTTTGFLDATLTNNLIEGVNQGIDIFYNNAAGPNPLLIDGNTIRGINNDAIDITYSDTTTNTVVISDNIITGPFGALPATPDEGIDIQPSVFNGTADVTIIGNTITGFNDSGIRHAGIGATNTGDITLLIDDNTISGNGVTLPTSQNGIEVIGQGGVGSTMDATITNNTMSTLFSGMNIICEDSTVNTFNVDNNSVTDFEGNGMTVTYRDTTMMTMDITNNTFNGAMAMATSPDDGIDLDPGTYNGMATINVDGNTLSNLIGAGIRNDLPGAASTGSVALTVNNNTVTGGGVIFPGGQRGVDINWTGAAASFIDAEITNNDFDALFLGIELSALGASGTGGTPNTFEVDNNNIRDFDNDGINIFYGGTAITDFTVTNNMLDGRVNLTTTPSNGIEIDPSGNVDGVVTALIDGNTILDFGNVGIYHSNPGAASTGNTSLTITDNTLVGAGPPFLSSQRGVRVDWRGTAASFIDCDVIDNTVDAVYMGMQTVIASASGSGGTRNRVNVDDNTFQDISNDGFEWIVSGTSETDLFVTNCLFDGSVNHGTVPVTGFNFEPGDVDGEAFMTIDTCTFRDFTSAGLLFDQASGGSTGEIRALVENCTINVPNATDGILVQAGGSSTTYMNILDNTISAGPLDGIQCQFSGSNAATVLGVNLFDNEAPDYILNGNATSTFNLGGTAATVPAVIDGNGNTTNAGTPVVTFTPTITIVAPGTIPLP